MVTAATDSYFPYIVLNDPYTLPFPDNHFDVIVSSSCFEHVPMFWLLFVEAVRVLKPDGLFYLCAPSNGYFHPSPVDCWRFYPHSALGLIEFARREGHDKAVLLESFTGLQSGGIEGDWNDFCAVFLKDQAHTNRYPSRITESYRSFVNGIQYERKGLLNPARLTQDQFNLNQARTAAPKESLIAMQQSVEPAATQS
jgi:SAM-dependent methyltransferase